ncbi:MAG: bifunctional pyr operon transcriptional regulator/uracil phosphoribosyltransferase PyrR [Cryomorphaceae bacterium]|nr:bifunctional pyr operon transcriptional regulator/uracil phosphoribosyltransferase PyrR [Cryomorphaceae bacterium]
MLEEREILNKESIDITIERLCHQLIEVHNTFDNTVLIGVQPRGAYLNNRILKKLKLIVPNSNIESGNVDISFYRDDLMRRDEPIVPDVMDINLSLEGKDVVLIDDVLFTGRSIRSAIDALMAFGRPKSVELLTLINRRFSRHLPIQPNYVGKTIDVMESEKIIVEWEENTGIDRVLIRQLK